MLCGCTNDYSKCQLGTPGHHDVFNRSYCREVLSPYSCLVQVHEANSNYRAIAFASAHVVVALRTQQRIQKVRRVLRSIQGMPTLLLQSMV